MLAETRQQITQLAEQVFIHKAIQSFIHSFIHKSTGGEGTELKSSRTIVHVCFTDTQKSSHHQTKTILYKCQVLPLVVFLNVTPVAESRRTLIINFSSGC